MRPSLSVATTPTAARGSGKLAATGPWKEKVLLPIDLPRKTVLNRPNTKVWMIPEALPKDTPSEEYWFVISTPRTPASSAGFDEPSMNGLSSKAIIVRSGESESNPTGGVVPREANDCKPPGCVTLRVIEAVTVSADPFGVPMSRSVARSTNGVVVERIVYAVRVTA